MLFNSTTFFLFLGITAALYLLAKRSLLAQNLVLLVASYVFYGFWDWRFLGLIAASTVVDFFVAKKIDASSNPLTKKRWLLASMVANLGTLGFFKYFNFFADNAVALLNMLGMSASQVTLDIILPVGISFYTFQTMSYTIDVYRGKLKATDSFIEFALFVSFFPQLVAGPIERASHFIPQIQKRRHINLAQLEEAVYLILYGYLLKVFLADNLAVIVNEIFKNPEKHNGLNLAVGVLAFAGQIYGDFAGYSSIARGVARLFGFDLMVNFRLPYFAISPSDFWRRWHISLSSWLRDYLYIALGGNRGSKARTIFNLSMTMFLGGLWHGAAWTYVIWGLYHGALLALFRILDWPSKRVEKTWYLRPFMWAFMFVFTLGGWLIFRATSPAQIVYFLSHMGMETNAKTNAYLIQMAVFWLPVAGFELIQHWKKNLFVIFTWPWWVRGIIFGLMLGLTIALGQRESIEFIYFQF